ncbi:MAG: heavy-metal-associated domain-containing protein [Ilumatobacteraceae bacterium]
MSRTTFSVPGMTCGHCEQAVSTELSKIIGVTSVTVDLESKQVVLSSESPVDWKAIVDAVDEAGFEAVIN